MQNINQQLYSQQNSMHNSQLKRIHPKSQTYYKRRTSEINNLYSNNSQIITSIDEVDHHQKYGQLSKLDLIQWDQKLYLPSENQRRLKIENDIHRNKLSSEKIRPREKRIKTEHITSLPAENYLEEFEQMKVLFRQTQKIQKEQNYNQIRHISQFQKLAKKGSVLSEYLCQKRLSVNQSGSNLMTKYTFDNIGHFSKKGSTSAIFTKKSQYMKSKCHSVNKRMQKILVKWRPVKKSVNERFDEIWVKPIQKINQNNAGPSRLSSSSKKPYSWNKNTINTTVS